MGWDLGRGIRTLLVGLGPQPWSQDLGLWDWEHGHGIGALVMALGPCPWVEVLPPGFRASLVALGPFLGV